MPDTTTPLRWGWTFPIPGRVLWQAALRQHAAAQWTVDYWQKAIQNPGVTPTRLDHFFAKQDEALARVNEFRTFAHAFSEESLDDKTFDCTIDDLIYFGLGDPPDDRDLNGRADGPVESPAPTQPVPADDSDWLRRPPAPDRDSPLGA